MAEELTLEQMAEKIDKLAKFASDMNEEMRKSNEKNNEEKEHKASDEEMQDAKKARRAQMEDDMRKAMDEKDDEKREAAMRKAMDDYDQKHEASQDEEERNASEEKEQKEHVASIISEKKFEIDNKILTAAKNFNPKGVESLSRKLKTNTFSASKKMYDDMVAIHGTHAAGHVNQSEYEPVPYFMAGVVNENIDSKQLNASSPASEFAQLSTQEILEMKR